MCQLAISLDQQDFREDGNGDLARRLVPQLQPHRGVQARILAWVGPQPPADAAQDERYFAATADQADVARARTQRRLEHAFVQCVTTGQNHHEIGDIRRQSAQRIGGEVGAADLRRQRKALASREFLAIVDHRGGKAGGGGDGSPPLAHVARAVEQEARRGRTTSRKTLPSPPHFMPRSSPGGGLGGSGSAASPAAVRAKRRSQEPPSPLRSCSASSITTASSGPPPTVPAMLPSGATSILAPASRGADRAVAVTVQSTNGSRAALLRPASWKSSTWLRSGAAT